MKSTTAVRLSVEDLKSRIQLYLSKNNILKFIIYIILGITICIPWNG